MVIWFVWQMKLQANRPDAVNPAMALRFAVDDHWRRVTDLERYPHKAMSVDQLETRIRTFEQTVARHFVWLEQEHGFRRGDCRVRDVDEPRGGEVSVRFERVDLTIEIGMALYYDKAALVIRDPTGT